MEKHEFKINSWDYVEKNINWLIWETRINTGKLDFDWISWIENPSHVLDKFKLRRSKKGQTKNQKNDWKSVIVKWIWN